EDLSRQGSFPSNDVLILFVGKTTGNPLPGNWGPLTVLKISGLPCLASASSNVSTQNDASIVIDTRHDRTRRENQSSTTARYTKPRAIGIYVTSIAHTWFGRVTSTPRSRYG